jgi:hypothetical protein
MAATASTAPQIGVTSPWPISTCAVASPWLGVKMEMWMLDALMAD